MAINPMQQQQSPDMLMAMMTDPRSTPQQRMAAMNALNALKGGANAPQQPPQMIGDSTGVSQMNPAFMAAVRQEMLGQGPEEQPEIPQRQAAPEAPQNPATAALMSGAADASRVAAMAQGGAVKGYAGSGPVIGQDGLPPDPNELLRIATTAIDPITRFRAKSALNAMRGQAAPTAAPSTEASGGFLSNLLDPTKIDYEEEDKKLEEYQTKGEGKDRTPFVKDIFKLAQKTDPFRLTSNISKATEPYARDVVNYFTGKRFEGDPENAPFEYELKPFVPLKVASIPKYNFNEEPVAPAEISAPRADGAKDAAAAAAKALTTPPPAAVEPGKPDPAAEAMNERKQAESDAYKERMDKLLSDDQPLSAQDKWMALARAGFAAAAGSSPNALQNIGAGLGKGLESLDELRKERAVNRMKQATLEQSRRSEDLSNEARNRQLDISAGGLKVEQGNLALKTAENDPTSPMGKAKLDEIKDRSNLYRAQAANVGRPDRETDAETLIKAYTNDPDNPAIRALLHLDPKNKSDDQKALDATNRAQSDAKIFGASNTDISPAGIQKVINFQDERENAYRERFGLPVIKFAASAPPKLTSDQQVNYDAAKKAIKEGKDRNAVLERLRASGVPTDGL